MYGFARARDWFDRYEIAVAGWMERHGFRLLRIAMGIIFIWFGALKPLGLSPAEALVAKATAWIPVPGFLYILAAWEIAISVCFDSTAGASFLVEGGEHVRRDPDVARELRRSDRRRRRAPDGAATAGPLVVLL